MSSPPDLRIDPSDTGLVIVDVQVKLAAAMAPEAMSACERNILVLLELARRQRWPILWSEQYPKGLGPTTDNLLAALTNPDLWLTRIEKITFSCTDDEGFTTALATASRGAWVVVGMESHVCVYQTARGLASRNARVFVPQDAVISRTLDNHRVGLDLANRAGAVVTSTEAVVFDALGRAGTEDFRAMSRLVK